MFGLRHSYLLAGSCAVACLLCLALSWIWAHPLGVSDMLRAAVLTALIIFAFSASLARLAGRKADDRIRTLCRELGRLRNEAERSAMTMETIDGGAFLAETLCGMLAELAETLAVGAADKEGRRLSDVLALFCRRLGISRASVWSFDPDMGSSSFTCSFASEDDRDGSPLDERCYARLVEFVVLAGVLLDEAELEREGFGPPPAPGDNGSATGSRSFRFPLYCAPMICSGRCAGVLFVERLREVGTPGRTDVRRLVEFCASILAVVAEREARPFSKAAVEDDSAGAGILARQVFMRLFDGEIKRADRYGDCLSVVLAAVDDVDAALGDNGRERAVQMAGSIFAGAIREMDTCARFGEGEFIMMLPQTNREGASKLAQRLWEKIGSTGLDVDGRQVRVTASVAFATFPDDAADGGVLIQQVYKALVKARDEGGNRVVAAIR